METTLQPSSQDLRTNIGNIEAIELSVIGFILWGLLAMMPADETFFNLVMFLVITEGALLGSWLIYNLYIRIARASGRLVDVGIWVFATSLTASYTFWAWTILDVNRWLVTKLLYRGEAPVEYAWSWRSKQVRKLWEQAHKAK